MLRITLFDDDDVDGDIRPSRPDWPGERVETVALLMPASSPSDVLPSTMETAFVPTPATEQRVTASEAWAALLAVLVLSAGSFALTGVVAVLLFR